MEPLERGPVWRQTFSVRFMVAGATLDHPPDV
jgi:hypothetical protein